MNDVRLFLCGDVMTGRGVDQIMQAPCDPALDEPYVTSALDYVELAERASGPMPRGVDAAYIWGDALGELERAKPDARVINLETAVTRSDERAPKGINYRMSPENAACLAAARIDCCALANNHVLDWGHKGLEDTLATLQRAGIRTAGAGRDAAEAAAPAAIELPGERRLLVFAFGSDGAGVPAEWAATAARSGVSWLADLSSRTTDALAERILAARREGDLVLVSVHWGSNWGYQVPRQQRSFARRLVDAGAVDLVHGHSSHHPRPIEIYRGRLILYGCGDFLNDYEGISGYEAYRPGLALMYFPVLDAASGRLVELALTPTTIRKFRVGLASREEADWLAALLGRESALAVGRTPEGRLRIR